MKLLLYGKAQFDAGLDCDKMQDRDKLPVIARGITRKRVLDWLAERRQDIAPGYVIRPDNNIFGFCLVNRDGDVILPDHETR